ncbi:hypothetical protein FRC15_005186 [Serendipita sp. 397]|nr:hypothetical protein FRC15_005186 [Serendipita sp. 397]KAG8777425.1 hypothetical protein FRC16_004160 [Serendipita sp. 398]
MGKKRKAIEIDEDDIIQTVLVSSPYGWKDPVVWDAEDRGRKDDGLYVFVEWLGFVFGAGAPGALREYRELGPIVGHIWYWNGRDELLASIRHDIDINIQIGSHFHSEIMKRPVPGRTKKSTITRARYIAEVQIVGQGEGWKPFPKIPNILPPSVRQHKFAVPYPLPSPVKAMNPIIQIFEGLDLKEEKKGETKGLLTQNSDVKPAIKREENVKADPIPKDDVLSQVTELPDVKPNLSTQKLGISPSSDPATSMTTAVKKEEPFEDMIKRAKARREADEVDESRHETRGVDQKLQLRDPPIKDEDGTTESFEDLIKRAKARRAAEETTDEFQRDAIQEETPQNHVLKHEEHLIGTQGRRREERPSKRVKQEE